MLINEVKKLGLSDKEAMVYLALLELGEATIIDIAKKAGVKRTSAYHSVELLIEKGLISTSSRKGKKYFYAESPKKIENYFEEKRILASKLVPELLSFANLLEKKPKIKFFEGLEGIKGIYMDMLNYENYEYLSWWTEDARELDLDFFANFHIPKRVKKKIFARAIVPDKEIYRQFQAEDQKQFRKTKLIPTDKLPMKVDIALYANYKIGIMSFKEKISLMIESKDIHDTLKAIFEMNWEMLK